MAAPTTSSSGTTGYLWHWSSGKRVKPSGGDVEVHSAENAADSELKFRFVPAEGAGHYGYIEFVKNDKVICPKGGEVDPDEKTKLILKENRHAGALFGFDEENKVILHKSGLVWRPKGGDARPDNHTNIYLHSKQDDTAKFYFGDNSGNLISPYPDPDLSGDWQLVQAFVTPLADHTYSLTYKVGKSTTTSETTQTAWKVSAEVAVEAFTASTELSGYVEKTSSETWTEEKEETYAISVTKGQSVYVWQYIFGMSRYGEDVYFKSSIIGDTNSHDIKPTIS